MKLYFDENVAWQSYGDTCRMTNDGDVYISLGESGAVK